MKLRVNAGHYSPYHAVGLREQARRLSSRKVLRFLDAASLAPFVVTATLYRADPAAEPDDVALYTLGGWDADIPDQPVVSDGSAASDAVVSRNILEETNPVTWLRMLSNNALCQVSISEGFRGPNAHLSGGPEVLRQVLAVAAEDLRRGAARQALIVAYDTVPEHRTSPSDRAPTAAAGLSLVPLEPDAGAGHDAPGGDALPRLFDLASDTAATSDSVLDVARACVDAFAGPARTGREHR
ncbi:hypothetical protein ACTWP5_31485 [Streptomyces sp. 4N509B]|uniref:hypothetical protein n=1 Tax=Streptomyces sp. 4N509B TaxID=3457413 RepID=UPI003FD31AF7